MRSLLDGSDAGKVQDASISVADILHLPDGDAADRRTAGLSTFEGALHHLGGFTSSTPADSAFRDHSLTLIA